MNAEQKYVISLLRRSFDIDADCNAKSINMPQVISMIGRNGILLTVYHSLPIAIQKALRERYLVLVRQHILQEYEGERVLASLSDAGMDCIALKGWELRKLYPHYGMRHMVDMDVLVRPYNYQKVTDVMNAMNYTGKAESSWKHDDFRKNLVLIEMHKRLTDDSGNIKIWENEMWAHAEPVNNRIYRMSAEDYYVFHFVHLHKDFMNGSLGLRRILDTWLLTHKTEADIEACKRNLDKFGMLKFHDRMVKLCRATMGEIEMDEASEFLLTHAFNHGIYGSDESYKAGRIAAMGDSLKSGKLRSKAAAVFLPYKRMKAQFPILEKWPILLPWCWAKRILCFVKGDIKEKREMLDYKSIGEDAFKEMKKFFEYGGIDS